MVVQCRLVSRMRFHAEQFVSEGTVNGSQAASTGNAFSRGNEEARLRRNEVAWTVRDIAASDPPLRPFIEPSPLRDLRQAGG